MSRYSVTQHLIVLNLYSLSINKILITEFIRGDSKFENSVLNIDPTFGGGEVYCCHV